MSVLLLMCSVRGVASVQQKGVDGETTNGHSRLVLAVVAPRVIGPFAKVTPEQRQVMLVVEGIMRAPMRCRQGDWGSFDGGASSPISTGSPFCQTTAY